MALFPISWYFQFLLKKRFFFFSKAYFSGSPSAKSVLNLNWKMTTSAIDTLDLFIASDLRPPLGGAGGCLLKPARLHHVARPGSQTPGLCGSARPAVLSVGSLLASKRVCLLPLQPGRGCSSARQNQRFAEWRAGALKERRRGERDFPIPAALGPSPRLLLFSAREAPNLLEPLCSRGGPVPLRPHSACALGSDAILRSQSWGGAGAGVAGG